MLNCFGLCNAVWMKIFHHSAVRASNCILIKDGLRLAAAAAAS
jgi:hypothetical protein